MEPAQNPRIPLSDCTGKIIEIVTHIMENDSTSSVRATNSVNDIPEFHDAIFSSVDQSTLFEITLV